MLAIIPLRSGSKSIKNKNIKLLNKYPLAFYVIRACLESNLFKDVVVASDSSKYEKILRKYKQIEKFKFIKRPKSISKDLSPTEETIDLVLKKFPNYKTTFLVQATSPLIESIDINSAKKTFVKEGCDSLFSAYKFKKFYWTKNVNTISHSYNYKNRPMRQKFKGGFVENGALYVFDTQKYLKYRNRLFGKIGVYKMPEFKSIDIDTIDDFKKASKILKEAH